MIRTKNHRNHSIQYPDRFVGYLNPFSISESKYGTKIVKKSKNGDTLETTMLRERTNGTLVAILSMVTKEHRRLQCPLKDIARAKGVSNNNLSNEEKVLGPLRKDLWDLTNVRIRFYPQNVQKKGFRFAGVLMQGEIDRSDMVDIEVSTFLERMIELGFFFINPKLFLNIRSPIVREVLRYFNRHRFINKESKVSLAKLCAFMNWNVDGRRWADIRQEVRKHFPELKEYGLDCKFDKTHCKGDGHLLIARQVSETKQLSASTKQNASTKQQTTTPYQETITEIKKLLHEYKKDWKEGDESKLAEQLKVLQEHLKVKGKELNIVVQDYCNWLIGGKRSKISYYAHRLFDPANILFERFEKWVENNSVDSKSRQKDRKPERQRRLAQPSSTYVINPFYSDSDLPTKTEGTKEEEEAWLRKNWDHLD